MTAAVHCTWEHKISAHRGPAPAELCWRSQQAPTLPGALAFGELDASYIANEGARSGSMVAFCRHCFLSGTASCRRATSVRGGRGGEPARARLRAARAHQHAHYNAQSFSKILEPENRAQREKPAVLEHSRFSGCGFCLGGFRRGVIQNCPPARHRPGQPRLRPRHKFDARHSF